MMRSTHTRVASALLFVATSLVSVSSRQSSGPTVPNGGPVGTRAGQSATLLPDGRWLVTGGVGSQGAEATIVVVDASTGKTQPLSTNLTQARSGHTATVMSDGSVLIIGGRDENGALVTIVERLDVVAQRIEALTDV